MQSNTEMPTIGEQLHKEKVERLERKEAFERGLLDNRELLLEAVQFIGFALTENMQEELQAVTAIEDGLIRNNWADLDSLSSTWYMRSKA
jgi:hypothetical protein